MVHTIIIKDLDCTHDEADTVIVNVYQYTTNKKDFKFRKEYSDYVLGVYNKHKLPIIRNSYGSFTTVGQKGDGKLTREESKTFKNLTEKTSSIYFLEKILKAKQVNYIEEWIDDTTNGNPLN